MAKYKLFAIDDYGKGYITTIGYFDTLEEIQIKPSMYAEDVVIEFESYGDESWD